MKTIACAIQEGGPGKSMLVTHLEFMAAERDNSVLAVDPNKHGTFSRSLGLDVFAEGRWPTLSLFAGARPSPSPSPARSGCAARCTRLARSVMVACTGARTAPKSYVC